MPDYISFLNNDIKGLKIGIPDEYFGQGLDETIKDRIFSVIKQLKDSGAIVKKISLPHSDYGIASYYIIATAEASSNLARYDSIRYGYRNKKQEDLINTYKTTRYEGFGEEVRRRIMLGTFALSAGYYDAFYLKAQQVRTLIKQDFDRVFEQVDVVVGPTSPTTAFKIGEKVNDPLQMYMSDVYTLSCNLAGICGLSLPCGFAGGLPIGLQIQGPAFKEESVIRVAYAYEQATPWHGQHPTVDGAE